MNGNIPWHIFMALHYIQKLINNMYHIRIQDEEKKWTFLERIVLTVKEYGQTEENREAWSFYDPEKATN